jgi:hypothetical protein
MMKRLGWALGVGLACSVVTAGVPGAARPVLSGTWVLNRELSDFPREVGFNPDWLAESSGGGQTGTGRSGGGGTSRSGGGGGRGGRSSGGGGSSRVLTPSAHFESEDDIKRSQELVDEVKNPSARLTTMQTDAAVTIVDDRGRAHTFHTNGKEETVELEAGGIGAITKWENAQLLVRYRVEKDRELQYRYGRDPATDRLVVEIRFADHGHGDLIRRVYDPATPN